MNTQKEYKVVLISILIACFSISCKHFNSSKGKTFFINGNVAGNYSDSLFLYVGGEKVDSTIVTNGMFSFRGKVQKPTLSSIFSTGIGVTDKYFFVENEKINIDLHVEKTVIQNYNINKIFIDTIYGTETALINYRVEDILQKAAISKISKSKAFEELKLVLSSNSTHPTCSKILNDVMYDSIFTNDQLIKLYQEVDIASQEKDIVNRIAIKLFSNDRKIGDNFINFSLPNTKGVDIDVKKVVGHKKYTLIDFWATWCIPCRNQFPGFIEILKDEKYNSNLSIIGVALDADEVRWKNVIDMEKLNWTNLIEKSAFQSKIAKELKILAIPRNYLVNQENKVIGVDLDPNELSSTLDSII